MKTVFTNNELPHIWAKQTQAHGRASSMHFDNNVIFSYGDHFPIAAIYTIKGRKLTLFTSESYSVSTAKHKTLTWRAIAGDHCTVPNVRFYTLRKAANDTVQRHYDNMNYFCDEIAKLLDLASRAREYGPIHLESIDYLSKDFARYVEFFTPKLLAVHKKMLASIKDKTLIPAALLTKMDAIKAQSAERARLREARAIEDEKNDLAAWLRGEDKRRYFSTTVCRIKDGCVETSRGASVKLESAMILAKEIGLCLKYDQAKLEGWEIDGYIVKGFDKDGALCIGCHVIPAAEVARMVDLLLK